MRIAFIAESGPLSSKSYDDIEADGHFLANNSSIGDVLGRSLANLATELIPFIEGNNNGIDGVKVDPYQCLIDPITESGHACKLPPVPA
jgi:hypothetical protein